MGEKVDYEVWSNNIEYEFIILKYAKLKEISTIIKEKPKTLSLPTYSGYAFSNILSPLPFFESQMNIHPNFLPLPLTPNPQNQIHILLNYPISFLKHFILQHHFSSWLDISSFTSMLHIKYSTLYLMICLFCFFIRQLKIFFCLCFNIPIEGKIFYSISCIFCIVFYLFVNLLIEDLDYSMLG